VDGDVPGRSKLLDAGMQRVTFVYADDRGSLITTVRTVLIADIARLTAILDELAQ
jgi:hypothetical protein